ncbi:MAG: DUF5103 domain-containing protein [Bacteroidales bacterium]|nr:DUF5103 domain-containing protein [Bacteroidales bacterium]
MSVSNFPAGKCLSPENKINYNASSAIQQENHPDWIYTPDIHSVELYREGWDLSWPVIDLHKEIPLILEFDDLSGENPTYNYTLVHCDAHWNPSPIFPTDYLSGFQEGVLRDYEFSRNTLQAYTHYRLKIPNDEMKPVLPGNYILKVYRDYTPDDLVLTRRFFVVDYRVEISGSAHRTENVAFFYTHQEVDLTIDHQHLPVSDPARELKVVICQNYNWSNALYDIPPTFINPGKIIYNWDEQNLFPGGNEFRHFDTKNLKFNSDRISHIEFIRPYRHVYLLPDPNRSETSYEYLEDLNGKYYIRWDEGSDSYLDADYVMVHFTLPFSAPMTGGNFYVWGELTEWATTPRGKMIYNFDNHAYELIMKLKQGYYNYRYTFQPEQRETNNPSFIEGNHYETENEYLIFVYYADPRLRYEQLIGQATFSSTIKKTTKH